MDTLTATFEAIETFANDVRQKFSANFDGEPEDQLRAPFEALTAAIGAALGQTVTSIGETRLTNNMGRPDFGISIDRILCGHIELKAPGKGADTTVYSGHQRPSSATP